MPRSALYFPAIRPPENEWFTRVLLYWDQVGTILPRELADDDVFLRPYTSALIREELLVPVSPEPGFWWGEAADHVKAFLDLLDHRSLQTGHMPTAEVVWARVHLTKIGYELATALEQRGLARELSHEPDTSLWIDIERRTANLLMAYLAVLVCKDETVGMDPITDSEFAFDAFKTLPEQDRQIDTDLQPIRYAMLSDILPGPVAGVEPARLAEFKHAHADLLGRFRTRVERKIIEYAQVADNRLRVKAIAAGRDELEEELVEIEQRMNERRWPMVVRGAVGIVIAALGLADLAVTGGGAFAVAGSSLGLAGAVDEAFQGRRRADIFENPLAFAAFARREFA